MTVVSRSNASPLFPSSTDVGLIPSDVCSGGFLGAAAFLGILVTEDDIGGVVSQVDIDSCDPNTTIISKVSHI